jgi:hypothetical protein
VCDLNLELGGSVLDLHYDGRGHPMLRAAVRVVADPRIAVYGREHHRAIVAMSEMY